MPFIEITFDEAVGRKIKEARQELGLKQGELAKILGISHMQMSYYERGKKSLRATRFMKICEVLKKPVEFFTGDEKITPSP